MPAPDLTALTSLCGEKIVRVESRRLAVEVDPLRRYALDNAPEEFHFAMAEAGKIYHLDGYDPLDADSLLASVPSEIDKASEEAQKAAVCLGYTLPTEGEGLGELEV